MKESQRNLFSLDELPDYKVATDFYDVRGWGVIDSDNRKIGKVDRLLVNLIAERVVYLDVELDVSIIEDEHNTYEVSANQGTHEFVNKDGDNHIIIPIGMASLDKENKTVISKQIDYKTFAKTIRFGKERVVNPDYEHKVLRSYLGDDAIDTSTIDERFYNRKEFEYPWNRKDKSEPTE